MGEDDWRNWKNGRYDNRYHGVRRHAGQRNRKAITAILVIVAVLIVGYFVYQNYITTEIIQKEDNNAINNASKIQPFIVNITKPAFDTVSKITSQVSQQVTTTPSTTPETSTPETNSLSSKPVVDISALEHEIHILINSERMQNGLTTLTFDPQLNQISRAYSEDMAKRHYFSHNTPEGLDPTTRGLLVGYHCHKDLANGYYRDGLAENIFQNNLYSKYYTTNGVITSYDWNDRDVLAITTVQGWMQSIGHRENILTSTFDREGIGVAISSDDKVYITEDFC